MSKMTFQIESAVKNNIGGFGLDFQRPGLCGAT